MGDRNNASGYRITVKIFSIRLLINVLIAYLDAYGSEFVAITPDGNMEVMLKFTKSMALNLKKKLKFRVQI